MCDAVEKHSLSFARVDLEDAELSQVDAIVRCHIAAFPGRFMTEMGPRWLKGLYSYFIKHDGGICLVAIDEIGTVLGFAVGGEPDIRDDFLYKAFFLYPHTLFFNFFRRRIVRKKLIAELIRKAKALHYCAGKSCTSTKQATNGLRVGNLLSIAVLPKCQGIGVSGKLIECFRKRAITKGFDILKLTVDVDNTRAITFYKKHDWCEIDRNINSAVFRLDLGLK